MGTDDSDVDDDELLERALAFAKERRAVGPDSYTDDDHLEPGFDVGFERIAASIRMLDAMWRPASPLETVVQANDATLADLSTLLKIFVAPAHGDEANLSRWTISRYEIVRELGRGGGGIVFLARDPVLKRQVAIKVPRPDALLSTEMRSRFLREAQAAAALEHPNIVPVYETAQAGPLCYIASAYCPGPTLAEWLRARTDPVPSRTAALCVKALADAVEHAHRRGVLHRDLKPANVILSNVTLRKEGEVIEDRHFDVKDSGISFDATSDVPLVPRITDFGLAKLSDHDGESTQNGAVIGTPKYMAPEQVAGQLDEIGPPADVYAIGVILYEMLCGRPPFWGESDAETFRQVMSDDAVRVRQLRRDVPLDLETICLKCLEKSPGRRYTSAADLSADLGRFLGGRPVHARPVRLWEKAVKYARRSPAAAALVLITALSIPLIPIVVVAVEHRLQRTRAEASLNSLFVADATGLPAVVHDLQDLTPFIEDRLRQELATTSEDSPIHLRAALVMVRHDSRLVDYLHRQIFRVSPAEIGPICDAISSQAETVVPGLVTVACDPKSDSNRRLRAACALARLDTQASEWDRMSTDVVEALLAEPPGTVLGWAQLLFPVREKLTPRIKAVYMDLEQRETSAGDAAATVLADYRANDWPALAEMLFEANPNQFSYFLNKLSLNPVEAIARLEPYVVKTLPSNSTEAEKDHHAKGRSNIAVALLRLQRPAAVRTLLQAQPDPRQRYYLIHRLGALDADISSMISLLESESDVSVRYGLVLAIGDFNLSRISDTDRTRLKEVLLRVYHEDADAGVHAAAKFTLSFLGIDAEKLKVIRPWDQAIARGLCWYTNNQGQTMAMVTRPDTFTMGSPENEIGRVALHPLRADADETLFTCDIVPFAISMYEITNAQYSQYPAAKKPFDDFSASLNCPVNNVSYDEAAAYCNWLSLAEGVPEGGLCYRITKEKSQVHAELLPGYMQLPGYRLPTEAEWEYACRHKTTTRRFFGDSDELIPKYAWFNTNSDATMMSVGQLRPNSLGLFDMLGNVSELCSNSKNIPNTSDFGKVILKGQSCSQPAQRLRSATRVSLYSNANGPLHGFRVARSLAPLVDIP